jgi:hypothetical protein
MLMRPASSLSSCLQNKSKRTRVKLGVGLKIDFSPWPINVRKVAAVFSKVTLKILARSQSVLAVARAMANRRSETGAFPLFHRCEFHRGLAIGTARAGAAETGSTFGMGGTSVRPDCTPMVGHSIRNDPPTEATETKCSISDKIRLSEKHCRFPAGIGRMSRPFVCPGILTLF